MKISPKELELMQAERRDYSEMLDSIGRPRQVAPSSELRMSCIGNAGGSDAVIQGKPAGGMLLRYAGRTIIIDPGENTLVHLKAAGFDPYSITDVIASHAHNDHVGDLTTTVAAALQLNLNDECDVNILVSPSLVDYTNSNQTRYGFTLPAFAWNAKVRVLHWENTSVTRFDGETILSKKTHPINGSIQVTSVRGKHARVTENGFIISTPMGKIGYTSDTEYFAELPEEYAGVDVLWLNMNTLGLASINDRDDHNPENSEPIKNHLGYVGACMLIENVKPSTVIVSHFGSQLLPMIETIQAVLRERFEADGINVFCALSTTDYVFSSSLSDNPDVGDFVP